MVGSSAPSGTTVRRSPPHVNVFSAAGNKSNSTLTFGVSGNNCALKHMATRGFRRNGFHLRVADASSAKLAFCGHDPHADTLLQLLHLDFTLSGFL